MREKIARALRERPLDLFDLTSAAGESAPTVFAQVEAMRRAGEVCWMYPEDKICAIEAYVEKKHENTLMI